MNVDEGNDDVRNGRPADGTASVVAVELFDELGAVIVVDGDLDIETVPQLEAAFSDTIAGGRLQFVVDLTAATFLDSMALGTLLRSLHPLHDEPAAAVAFVGAHGIVERSLTISGIGQMFTAFDSREAALDALRGATEPLRDQWRGVQHSPCPPGPLT
jgi:anti-anti-sigma factor